MIILTSKTDASGKLFIHGKEKMDDFFKKNPNSTFSIRIDCFPELASERMVNFYQYVALPELQIGFKLKGSFIPLDKIDAMLRRSFVETITESYEKEIYIAELKDLKEIGKESFLFFLDFVKLYAASNLQVFLEDPRAL